MAAEYIVSSGNPNVILCERGIRTFETYTRNTMDLAAVPLLHHLTHLPVIVDPSHATGQALARQAARPRRRRGRRRRRDGRGPPATRTRRCPTPSSSSTLDQFRDADGRPRPGPRAGPRRSTATRSGPASAELGGDGRAGQALSAPSVRPDRVRRSPGVDADVARSVRAARLRGELRLPGDKSISHRALLLAALADGESRIEGAGDGADVRSTAGIVRALGATVERVRDDGRDGRLPGRLARRRRPRRAGRRPRLRQLRDEPAPGRPGILAGLPMTAVLDGDASLRRRPVARIIEPLRSMGAVLHARRNDSLPPVTVVGHTPLRAIDITTPVPSAQVKSAILLAGLRADGRTTVRGIDRDARSHGAHASGAGRAGRASGRGRAGPVVAWTVEGGRSVRAVDGAGPRGCLGGRLLARRRRDPSRRRADPARRRREPDPPGGHRPAPGDGRRHRGAATAAADREPTTASASRLADLTVRSSELRGDRPRPGRGRGGDRRDPDPLPGRDRRPRHDRDPRRRRAAPQGIGPDRRDRRRPRRARRRHRDRRRRHPHRRRRHALRGAATDSLDDHRLAMTFAIAGLIAIGRHPIARPASAAISYPGFFDELERVRA